MRADEQCDLRDRDHLLFAEEPHQVGYPLGLQPIPIVLESPPDSIRVTKQGLDDPALALERLVGVEHRADAAQHEQHLPEAESRQAICHIRPGRILPRDIVPGATHLKPLPSRGLIRASKPIGQE